MIINFRHFLESKTLNKDVAIKLGKSVKLSQLLRMWTQIEKT